MPTPSFKKHGEYAAATCIMECSRLVFLAQTLKYITQLAGASDLAAPDACAQPQILEMLLHSARLLSSEDASNSSFQLGAPAELKLPLPPPLASSSCNNGHLP